MKNAKSGDNLYQVAGVRFTNAKALFTDGYAYDLMELDNITLDAPIRMDRMTGVNS